MGGEDTSSFIEVKYFKKDEISKHSTRDDLWMIIYNKVYDVSDFIDKHPGGGEVLFDCGGVDATEAFEDVGHSEDAIDMLTPFYIGELDSEDVIKTYQSPKQKSVHRKNNLFLSRFKNINWKLHIEKNFLSILVFIALFALLGYVLLQRKKWTDWID